MYIIKEQTIFATSSLLFEKFVMKVEFWKKNEIPKRQVFSKKKNMFHVKYPSFFVCLL